MSYQSNGKVSYEYVTSLLEKGAADQARVQLNKIVTDDPSDSEAWFILAGVCSRLGAMEPRREEETHPTPTAFPPQMGEEEGRLKGFVD